MAVVDERKAAAAPAMPPLEVDKATLDSWTAAAQKSVAAAMTKGLVKRDLPPGLDPDDEHKYVIRLPT